MDYIDVPLKLVIGILYAVSVMKISGKDNLAPLAPIDQIQNYTLGGIIGGVLYNKEISLLDFTYIMTIWAVLSLSINLLRKKNGRVKDILDGKTITVIHEGDVVRKGIEGARLPLPDLYLKLRFQNKFDIKEINHAQIEQNGQLVAITKEQSEKFPILIVVDKVVMKDNLKLLNKDEQWIEEIMKEHKIRSLDDIAAIEYFENKIRIVDFC